MRAVKLAKVARREVEHVDRASNHEVKDEVGRHFTGQGYGRSAKYFTSGFSRLCWLPHDRLVI
jgi:hypothetical protein